MALVEGVISSALEYGSIALRVFAADNLDTPLEHVTGAHAIVGESRRQIYSGYAVVTTPGANLVFQVGFKTAYKNFGFGLRISRGDKESTRLVDSLYFPSTGSKRGEWFPGTVSVDDHGHEFLVRSTGDLGQELGKTESIPYAKLTFTVWPILGWQVGEKVYGKQPDDSANAGPRSTVRMGGLEPDASRVGITEGKEGEMAQGMYHARILSEDFDEKRVDMSVYFLTGSVKAIAGDEADSQGVKGAGND